MRAEGLIYGQSRFPVSMTLVVAWILLAIGIFAVVSMNFHVGPFH
jgi:putative membrane protein